MVGELGVNRMVIPAMEIIVSVVLLFAGIAILLLIHVCLVRGAFREGGNILIQRMSGVGDGSVPIPQKMTSEDIGMLPCFKFGDEDGKGIGVSLRQTDCAVCLECFVAGDMCRLLWGCGHCFHACCIDGWIAKTPVCPVCRTRIVTTRGRDRRVDLVGGASASAAGGDLV